MGEGSSSLVIERASVPSRENPHQSILRRENQVVSKNISILMLFGGKAEALFRFTAPVHFKN